MTSSLARSKQIIGVHF